MVNRIYQENIKLCNYCYSPRISNTSITQEDKVFCSMDCFYKCNNIQLDSEMITDLEDEIEHYKGEVLDLENTISNQMDEITDLESEIKELNSEIFDLEQTNNKLVSKIDEIEMENSNED